MSELGGIKYRADGIAQTKHKYVWAACEECGEPRWVAAVGSENKPRSRRCQDCGHRDASHKEAFQRLLKVQKREGHPNWKGGRFLSRGYWLTRLDEDNFFYPMADQDGYVREHRLIMAKQLKRRLLPWEVVHHKNGVKGDNRIQNLELISAQKYHFVDSRIKAYINRLENEVAQLKVQLENQI